MTIHEDYFNHTLHWKKEYGEKTIVFMQVGSFYEVYALRDQDGKLYGSNILNYAEINDLVIANKHISVRGPIPGVVSENRNYQLVMAGFGITQLDKYINKMQDNGYTIVLYDQDIQGKNTSRSVSSIISPGTHFSENSMNPSNHTMCIWLERSRANKKMPSQITVGISWLDIFTGKSRIAQFSKEYNHNPCTYDQLERIVAINNPSECLIISEEGEDFMDDIINYAGISSKKIHTINLDNNTDIGSLAIHAQRQTYQNAVYEKFFPNVSFDNMLSEMPTHFLAIQSFVFLLDFIYKQNPNLVDKLALPLFESTTDTLLLANHSLQQLNMIDEGRHSGKLSSVSSLLNHCLTTMGKRRFLYNLHNPITDANTLQQSYDITEHLLDNNMWQQYRNDINGIHDIERFKRKLIIKKVAPKDLSVFYSDLQKIFSLDQTILESEEVSIYIKTLLSPTTNRLQHQHTNTREINEYCADLMSFIDRNFYVDKCLDVNNITPEYLGTLSTSKLAFIKPGVSEQVDSLLMDCIDSRRKLEAIANWLSKQVATVEKKTKTMRNNNSAQVPSYVKIHETPKSDPVLLGTNRRLTILKKVLGGMNIKDNTIDLEYLDFAKNTQTFSFDFGCVKFESLGSNKKDLIATSDYIKVLTSSIQRAESQLVSATLSYYKEFIVEFTEYQKQIEYISNFSTIVDILQCKCYVADTYNYCKPIIRKGDKSYFDMEEVRHPLIEHLQTKEIYVVNDLSMGNCDDTKSNNGLLLYGTNAVGKTSLIKSIGINIIMAQAGLYVACSKMEYSPYNAIFTRILGNDNIFKGLSTFEVEMSELSTILKMSDSNSLILGDELCSGTESDSALSIFTASLESLHERGSTFLFATHFHEIQNYDEIRQLDSLVSKHMEVSYDRENDRLVYDRKLRDGPGDSMYGLEVCKALRLPDKFLERAHSIRMIYNNTTKNVLSEKGSKYNASKIKGQCEMCKVNRAMDTHHLQHQKSSNSKGFIGSFHKNHKANLMSLCKDCHLKIHENDEEHIRVKTSDGYKLQRV